MAKNRRQPRLIEGPLASRPLYTPKQGQYLAFIHSYQKVHRRPPAESDLQEYFRVSAPSVHDMILRLEEQGLISRVRGEERSIQILLPPELLQELES